MRTAIFSLFLFLLAGHSVSAQGNISIVNLRCEYLTNPLGIDIQQPRFSWELTSSGKNKKQTARQILVATDPALLSVGKADAWESGKTGCSRTAQIVYQGKPLKPYTVYYWKVSVWDELGKQSAWSPVATFSTGAFSAGDWKAQWIGDDEAAFTPKTKYYAYPGYFCDAEIQPFAEKWVTVDLGSPQLIDEIKLFPAASGKEKLFPLHFKVEVASNPDFIEAQLIAGEMNDTQNTEKSPYTKKLSAPVTGQFVKLTVTKLPSINKNMYEYGLSEIEILYQGKNLALNRPVQASDTKIEYRWGDSDYRCDPFLLTDGRFKPEGASYFKDIPPVSLLRTEITTGKKIKKALYHVSALGIYEAYINGKKVGKQILAPEWTDYDHHVQYQTFDVSDMLQNGKNALSAMLADGWYSGTRWSHPGRGGYGGFARRFLAQLTVYYEDGTSETIATDNSWKYFNGGPITQVTTFGGEEYDAKNEQKGWDKPGFDDSKWTVPAVSSVTSLPARANGKYVLCAQMNEPIAVIEEVKPIAFHKTGDNRYVFDMGQNMVGWCRLNLPYNPNRDIKFRYAEVLNDDQTIYVDNLRGATQIDIYHPAGETKIEYEPRFTYHGFRFVEIEGLTQTPQLNSVLGKFVASSSPIVGDFKTSDKDVNKLWENIRRTQWGNMISVPTDCPQRDEREGWTGDAQVFAQTAIYNLDMAGFYTKWMRDIRDDQLPDGRLPDISPNDGTWQAFYNAPGWADAGVIIPWRVYQNYSDTVILSKQYACIKRFIDFIHRRNPNMLWQFSRGHMYGDWLNGNTIIAENYPKDGGQVSNDVFATAYFAYSTEILAKIAKLLGKEQEHDYYSTLAANIRKTFVENYVSDDGKIYGNTQAGYAIALEFDLLPENLRAKAAAHMAEALKPYDGRMSTGIHSTVRLMNQLSEYGYSNLAYGLLLSRRFPSWLYSVDQGATTIWERWDGYVAGRGFQDAGMNSFNHVAIGAVGEWMYRHVLGIQYDESQPGYSHFYIKPQPGKSLEWAKGSYRSIAGDIAVSWTRKNSSFSLAVTVPVNTEATVVLPDGQTHRVGSGKHSFTAQLKQK
ncbi:MAG: family 78 glycoside hydrolase catalytic domain [Prevotellaceae bacterium]|nr:family 78 glycoside hydrolase catalytic domain [Prevotellaceae bacterium]